jgi:hypothetical protein
LLQLNRYVFFFSVFGGILPAMYRWFSKKLSTSAVVHQKGLWKKYYFGCSGVYFIFILHLYITVTCRHTIILYGKDCFSNTKMSSKCLEYLNIFLLFFKKFSTSRNPLKSIFSLFWLYIWDHYINNLCTFHDSFEVMKSISK